MRFRILNAIGNGLRAQGTTYDLAMNAIDWVRNAIGAGLRSNPATADLVILVPVALFFARQIVRNLRIEP